MSDPRVFFHRPSLSRAERMLLPRSHVKAIWSLAERVCIPAIYAGLSPREALFQCDQKNDLVEAWNIMSYDLAGFKAWIEKTSESRPWKQTTLLLACSAARSEASDYLPPGQHP